MADSPQRDGLTGSQSEEQLNLLETITMEVAAAGDLADALGVVLHRVCEKTGWVLGQAWVPSQDGTVLECGPVWYGDEANLKSFRAASEECKFAPGIGLPGRVWALRRPAWVEDVTNDPANSCRGTLVWLDGGRVVVRLDLERDGQSVADRDDAGVLARAGNDPLAGRRQRPQQRLR